MQSGDERVGPAPVAEIEAIRMRLGRITAELALIDTRLARLSVAAPDSTAVLSRSHSAGTRGLLRIEEVAERTGVAVSTLRHWRQAKTGPKSARVGRRVVYRASDVEAWLEQQLPRA